jgi:hypothetical protein
VADLLVERGASQLGNLAGERPAALGLDKALEGLREEEGKRRETAARLAEERSNFV